MDNKQSPERKPSDDRNNDRDDGKRSRGRRSSRGRGPTLESSDDNGYDPKQDKAPTVGAIVCPFIPDAANADKFVGLMRDNVNAAAERVDDLTLEWYNRIFEKGVTFESLSAVPKKMFNVDRKMGQSCWKEIQKHPTTILYKKIVCDKDRLSNSVPPIAIRGQQIVYRMIEATRTNDELGTFYSSTDIINLWPKGQTLKDIDDFSWGMGILRAEGNRH